jgi:hypothetical protein
MKHIEVDRDNLCVEILPNGRWCELQEDLELWFGNYRIIVPKDFQTDFASVPRLFWSIIPPMGKHTIAAVVHDYLYHTAEVSRKKADQIFYWLMRYYGVGKLRALVMYYMVRIFGKRAYRG